MDWWFLIIPTHYTRNQSTRARSRELWKSSTDSFSTKWRWRTFGRAGFDEIGASDHPVNVRHTLKIHHHLFEKRSLTFVFTLWSFEFGWKLRSRSTDFARRAVFGVALNRESESELPDQLNNVFSNVGDVDESLKSWRYVVVFVSFLLGLDGGGWAAPS